jgi:hypothetical protein
VRSSTRQPPSRPSSTSLASNSDTDRAPAAHLWPSCVANNSAAPSFASVGGQGSVASVGALAAVFVTAPGRCRWANCGDGGHGWCFSPHGAGMYSLRVQQCAARCGQNCGHRGATRMPATVSAARRAPAARRGHERHPVGDLLGERRVLAHLEGAYPVRFQSSLAPQG